MTDCQIYKRPKDQLFIIITDGTARVLHSVVHWLGIPCGGRYEGRGIYIPRMQRAEQPMARLQRCVLGVRLRDDRTGQFGRSRCVGI